MNPTIRTATLADCTLIAEAIAISSGGYAQLGWQQAQKQFPGHSLQQVGALYIRDEQTTF